MKPKLLVTILLVSIILSPSIRNITAQTLHAVANLISTHD